MTYQSIPYKTINLSQEARVIIKHPVVAYALKAGGFIAGGFTRQLFNKRSLKRYFNRHAGDIDIFFPSVEVYREVCNLAKQYVGNQYQQASAILSRSWSVTASLSGFCTDVRLPMNDFFASRDASRHVKIQLVNLFHGKPEDVLETFDIENCKVALTCDHLIYSDALTKLELLNTIQVVHSNSPLLAKRIMKYKFNRNLYNFHPESSSVMRDWLVSWRVNKWKDHPFGPTFEKIPTAYDMNVKQLLKYPELIHDDHLSLLFGRLTYKKNMGCSYSPWYQEFDAGIEELKRRNQSHQ
jgi:hypothetical protein